MIIKTWRDPYDIGVSFTRPRKLEIKKGLTVLVGCNGAGKTTLLRNIEEECKEAHIPCHSFDNLHDGGHNSIGAIFGGFTNFACDDSSMGASLWTASEGEAIKLNIGRQSTLFKDFLETGEFKDHNHRMIEAFKSLDKDYIKAKITDNRRVLLFDASDSGLSIDNVCEIKNLFRLMIKDAEQMGVELYIIISANEYELCRKEYCMDVNTGKYRNFSGYESYRNFILRNRKKKETRIEKSSQWLDKHRLKDKQ